MAGEEGDGREWDGWMESQTQWTWVWANSERRQRTGKPGVLTSMGFQRLGHDWATEQEQFLYNSDSVISLIHVFTLVSWSVCLCIYFHLDVRCNFACCKRINTSDSKWPQLTSCSFRVSQLSALNHHLPGHRSQNLWGFPSSFHLPKPPQIQRGTWLCWF